MWLAVAGRRVIWATFESRLAFCQLPAGGLKNIIKINQGEWTYMKYRSTKTSFDSKRSSHCRSKDLWYAVIYVSCIPMLYLKSFKKTLVHPKILPLIRLELCSPHLVGWMLPMQNRGSCISHPKKSVENRCILRSQPAKSLEKPPEKSPFFCHPFAPDFQCPASRRKKLYLFSKQKVMQWIRLLHARLTGHMMSFGEVMSKISFETFLFYHVKGHFSDFLHLLMSLRSCGSCLCARNKAHLVDLRIVILCKSFLARLPIAHCYPTMPATDFRKQL